MNSRRGMFSDLKAEFSNVNKSGYFVPISWDNDSDGATLMLPLNWRWLTLEKLFKELPLRAPVIHVLPLVWQLEPLLNSTVRKLGGQTISIPNNNLPSLKLFVDNIGADVVVTTPDMIFPIYEALSDAKNKLRAMVVIHKSAGHLEKSFADMPIFHELHLIPGVVLADQQIESEEAEDVNLFSLTDLFMWSSKSQNGILDTLSCKKNLPFQFVNQKSPFCFRQVGKKYELLNS